MPPFRRIAVRVDAGREHVALREQLTALIANASGVDLELIHVVEPIAWYARPFLHNADELERARREHWEHALEALAVSLRRPGVEVGCRVVSGRASSELGRIAAEGERDLVAIESPAATGPIPSDLHTLRDVPCPVWVARPIAGPIRRVLAAVDPRPGTPEVDPLHLEASSDPAREALVRRILKLAASVAEALGAELHVVHAWAAPGEELLRGETLLSPDQVKEYVEAAGGVRRAAFERALSEAGLDLPTERRHCLKGPAEDVILARIEELNAGLVVIGTVARGGLAGLLGGTAESVLRHAPCSLLAVKPADDPGH